MKKLTFIFLAAFSLQGLADPTLSDQLHTLEAAQSQAQENARARDAAAKNAMLMEQRRQQEVAEQNARIAADKAKVAEAHAREKAKIENEERLQDKYRRQSQEDQELEIAKRQSELELKEKELELQRLKAKADLELAVAQDRIKTVDVETSIARKQATTDIDVTQSEADATRAVAGGVSNALTGYGNEGFYKFLVVFLAIVLVLIIAGFVWFFLKRQKPSA